MNEALQRRARRIEERRVVRAWEYRQRGHAAGVWFRLRWLLCQAELAYEIPDSAAEELRAAGRVPDPVGQELEPPVAVFVLPRRAAERIADRRPLAVRLDANLLAARSLVLVPFFDHPPGGGGDS